jgi:hypothetical protein
MSSCLMCSGNPVKGVLAERADSSEGKVEVTGVCSGASLGLVVEPIATPDRNECWRYPRNKSQSTRRAGKLATTEKAVRRGRVS